MELNNFQYTAPSNSSAAYFPNNKPNEFQVKVPHPITIAGEWEVSLVDIQYHSAWLTLDQPQHFLLWMYPEETRLFDLINYEADKSDDYYLQGEQSWLPAQDINWSRETYTPFTSTNRLHTTIALPAGNYNSISDCVSALNHEILMFWSRRKWPAKLAKHKDLELSFHYNSTSKQLITSHIGFNSIQFVSLESSILSGIGFHYIKTHKHKAVNRYDEDRLYYVFDGTKAGSPKLQTQTNNNFMYIHSNIIQHQNFGHQKAQLLAIVPVRSGQGEQSYWKCDPPLYLPLKTSELDSIDIKILNEKGEPFPFSPDKNLIIRLHFRRLRGIV
jgi:hypothetical protein